MMANLKLKIVIFLGICVMLAAAAVPLKKGGSTGNGGDANTLDSESSDQVTSGSGPKPLIADIEVAESSGVASAGKSDLKTSDSYGLGYYLPIVAPIQLKYHYPFVYYHAYPYYRHHGYGAYGYYHHAHGHSVLHH